MPGIVLAWAVGEGIIIYRSVRKKHAPPMPGQLLASSGLFVLLGLLAQAQSARLLAASIAWGFDLAAYLNLAPSLTGGTSAKSASNILPTPSGGQAKPIGETAA